MGQLGVQALCKVGVPTTWCGGQVAEACLAQLPGASGRRTSVGQAVRAAITASPLHVGVKHEPRGRFGAFDLPWPVAVSAVALAKTRAGACNQQ